MNERGLSPGEGTARRLREFGDEITLGRSLLAEAEKAIKDLEAQNHALTIKTQELVSALGSAEASLAQQMNVARAGVGIQFGKTGPGPFTIHGVTPGSAAALCGLIAVGDKLHGVDDKSVYHLDVQQTMELLGGPAGSHVTVWTQKAAKPADKEALVKIELRRESCGQESEGRSSAEHRIVELQRLVETLEAELDGMRKQSPTWAREDVAVASIDGSAAGKSVKDSLLETMRDLHEALRCGIYPAACTLRLEVPAARGPALDHQGIKFALHRDICEALGVVSFASLHVAYVAPASAAEGLDVSQVVAGVTLLPCARLQQPREQVSALHAGGLVASEASILDPQAIVAELLRQFNDDGSALKAPHRITSGLVVIDLAPLPSLKANTTTTTAEAAVVGQGLTRGVNGAENGQDAHTMLAVVSEAEELQVLLEDLDAKYQDETSALALENASTLRARLEQSALEHQGLQVWHAERETHASATDCAASECVFVGRGVDGRVCDTDIHTNMHTRHAQTCWKICC